MKIVEEGMELEQYRPGGRKVLDSFKSLYASHSVWLEDEGQSEGQQEIRLGR